MFEKENIAIDINSDKISILVGTKYKISNATILDTPEGAFINDRIVDVNKLGEVIRAYLKKSKIKSKDVSFVLRGEDLITRHIVMPMVKEEAMRDSVDFELRQFIGDKIDEYYFDYEVISYNKEENNGNADVFIVAAEKDKIDEYIELGKILNLNVKAIDIYANLLARVYRNLKPSFLRRIKSVGIISIDNDSSSITITEWGKLVLEKYQIFGMENGFDRKFKDELEYDNYINSIDLTEVKEEEELIDKYFKDLVTQFNSFIQYYTVGKVKKNLDRIFIVGAASRIRGIQQYFEVNLNARSGNVPTFLDMKSTVKVPKRIHLKDYIYCYGLLLRRG